MAGELSKLKLGKGSAFVKRDLRLLPQTKDVWEADFLPFPPKGRSRSREWLGIVVSRKSKFPFATRFCETAPTVNDLAYLLSYAMRRPIMEIEGKQRPRRIHLRDNPQWAELVPHLEQLGIEVSTAEKFALCEKEAADLFGKEVRRPSTGGKGRTKQPGIEGQYPNVAKWVKGYGWIEIGIHDWEGFQARALDEGGLIYENTDCDSLAGAMKGLETELGRWFKERDR
jgi:hypothetical protein